jgi:hypothetical protein
LSGNGGKVLFDESAADLDKRATPDEMEELQDLDSVLKGRTKVPLSLRMCLRTCKPGEVNIVQLDVQSYRRVNLDRLCI